MVNFTNGKVSSACFDLICGECPNITCRVLPFLYPQHPFSNVFLDTAHSIKTIYLDIVEP